MAVDSKKNEGARAERKAMRAHLKREISRSFHPWRSSLEEILDWLNKRSKRCGDKLGGLGRK